MIIITTGVMKIYISLSFCDGQAFAADQFNRFSTAEMTSLPSIWCVPRRFLMTTHFMVNVSLGVFTSVFSIVSSLGEVSIKDFTRGVT